MARSNLPHLEHPVWQTLTVAAQGANGIPTDEDLAEMQLPADTRRALAAACLKVATMHENGDQALAQMEADDVARELIMALPDATRDPRYLEREAARKSQENMTPDQLAALVPRY